MNVNTPHMFDYWADPVVHLPLVKISMPKAPKLYTSNIFRIKANRIQLSSIRQRLWLSW